VSDSRNEGDNAASNGDEAAEPAQHSDSPSQQSLKAAQEAVVAPAAPRRKRGRPSKAELAAKTPGGRGKVGRPKGDASIINEYKARMLASPKSQAVLDKIFAVALDDEHKNQAACMKLLVDRILPISYFEKDKKQGGIGGVNITISTATPDSGVVIDGSPVADMEPEL
jgi:hypothetical protein